MKKVLAALAAASWLAACGGSNTTTPPPTGPQQYDQTQKAVSPKGTIYGRVTDVANQNPLEGVSVKVLGSDSALTSAADGTFKLENVVVNSSYTFIFEKMGYLRTRTSSAISGSTGNSPLEGSISSFSIEMFPSNGTVTGFVFLPNGRPAPNATVYVDQRNFGESVVTAQTGADGSFSIGGLATRPSGANHTVYAQWFDENGDMQADYSTTSTNVNVFPGQPARTFITYNSVGLRLVASNIIDGEIPAGEDLQFTFSLPLFTGTLDGTQARPWILTNLSIGNGNVDVPAEGTFMSPTVLRVKPALNSLQEGQRYNIALSLRAASLSQNTTNNFNQSFDFQVRAATVTPFTTQVTGLAVTNQNPIAPYPDTAFDFNQNQFTIAFTPAAGAVRYEIYARDTASIPNFTRLTAFNADGSPRYQRNLNVGTPFNVNFASGLFAAGNRVTFAVVGIDAYGARAPLMSAPTVEVRDTIPPRVTAGPVALPLGTTPDGINDGTTAATIALRISYSEPMDPASMVTYTSNATNAPMAAFRWDSATTGVLTLTVGAGNDATGSFVIRGGKDSSGNDLQQAGDLVGFLGGRKELLQTPDFQNGTMCGLGTSWVPSTLNGGPNPTTINNNGAISGNVSPCAAVLGSVPGGTPGTGRSRILQGISLPSLMNTGFSIQASGRYRTVNVTNTAQPGATYTMRCFFADTNDAPLLGLGLFASAAPTTMTSFTTAGPVNLTAQQNTQVRLICEAENTNMMAPGFGALYLDEMSVALVKTGTL